MIVRDETELLPRCLQSVRDLVDEIVIVDTGSVDKTVEIAAAAGARVFSLDWPGDFALARNHAITQAQGNWILMLDADEYITEAAREVLRAFCAHPPAPARFSLKILNPDADGQPGGVYYMDRLFPRRPEIRYVAPLHEYLLDSGSEPTQALILPGLDVQHSGRQPDQIARRGKLARNHEILTAAIARWPQDPHCRYHLASICLAQGQPARALKHYQKLLQGFTRLPDAGHSFFALAIIEMMECLAAVGLPAEALALAAQAEAGCAHHPDYWLQRGRLLRSSDLQAARTCFWRCLQIDQASLQMAYDPASLFRLPLLQLLQINRVLSHHPDCISSERQQARRELQQVLTRLLSVWPSGELTGPAHNLHLLLAETVIPEPDPPASYWSLLPEPARELPQAEQTSAILNLLSGQLASLTELPPIISLETLPQLANQLWNSDKPFLAQALLHLGMLVYSQPAFADLLAQLLNNSQQQNRAHQVLLESRLIFPNYGKAD